ncbi:MAG: hypothetical protein QOH67_1844 [Hyphomicrobiales bacterium]|jgi:hypothetical protein|nr:hypothetical protein [Hyphomicrobiales bacterium]
MRLALLGTLGAAFVATGVCAQMQNTTPRPQDLRPVSSFSGIADQADRSRALFNEIAKVVTHPRCMNCHPAGEHPTQGNDRHEHLPPAPRGEAGAGVAGLTCSACHMEKNFTLVGTDASYKSIPGHPRWQLAPLEMAWQGKSLRQICEQLKDPARNGGRTLALLQEHFAKDDLVAWGWAPGEGREPAPGSQQQVGELAQAWIDSGAQCPN